jgi:hypothetical protein
MSLYQQEIQQLKETEAKLKELHRRLCKLELHIMAADAFNKVKEEKPNYKI